MAGRREKFIYTKENGDLSERDVTITSDGEGWVRGWDHDAEGPRTFRTDQIESVAEDDDPQPDADITNPEDWIDPDDEGWPYPDDAE